MADDRVILITARSFGSGREDPEQRLLRAGLRTLRGDPSHDLAAIAPQLANAVGWIAGTGPIRDEHMALGPHLRIIARYGVGLDSVDLDAARRRSITVTNTPGANSAAVADLTVGLILAALRRIVEANTAFKEGKGGAFLGRELGACTVGIVGYGTIGQLVHARLAGFGASVVAHDPFRSFDDVPSLSLPELAQVSDVVTLHAPGVDHPIVDEAFLAAMPPGGILVNTARASLVDERAVLDALRSGHLDGFATDVLDPGARELLALPTVVATPHIGGHSVGAIDRMGLQAAEACLQVLA